jgi:3-dehydroquinate dehydratase-2
VIKVKIKVLNGPNLNMLGIREPSVYGYRTYTDLVKLIEDYCLCNGIQADICQSNYEGKLIDEIHEMYFTDYDALIINPGALTHYSYALRDALNIIKCLKIEVHISDIYKRESFRAINVIKDEVDFSIVGKGLEGYIDAVNYVISRKR